MSEPKPKKPKKRLTLKEWIARFQKTTAAVVIASFLALVILLGTAVEKAQKITGLFSKASENANEIAKMRERIEAQSATIDLVARKAADVEAMTAKTLKTAAELEAFSEFLGV